MSTKSTTVTIGKKPMEAIMAAWRAEAARELAKSGNKPTGDGWLTATEVRAALGFGVNKTGKYLAAATRDGRVDVFKGSEVRDGHGHPMFWYRLK